MYLPNTQTVLFQSVIVWAGHDLDPTCLLHPVLPFSYTIEQNRFSPISFRNPFMTLGSLSFWLVFLVVSGACFLISPYNALISWRWGLCSLETPYTVVSPKWLGSWWGGSWLGCSLSWSSWHGQNWCTRQCGLTPLFCLSCNLAALQEGMESGGPETGFVTLGVEVIRGGGLSVKSESGTD